MIIAERVHGVVCRINYAIVIAVGFLHTRLEHAHNLKTGAIDANGFANGGNT